MSIHLFIGEAPIDANSIPGFEKCKSHFTVFSPLHRFCFAGKGRGVKVGGVTEDGVRGDGKWASLLLSPLLLVIKESLYTALRF
jgi:hypothetical protein